MGVYLTNVPKLNYIAFSATCYRLNSFRLSNYCFSIMEIPENSEIVTPPAEKNPNKQSNEEPKEPTPPKTEADAEKITEEAKELKKKSSDKDKQLASEAKSHSIRETPASGDSEVRQPRARKQVQRWSEVLSKAFTEEQEAREKALDAQLAKGSGTALGEIPLIESSIRKYKPVDLKLLHFACFGRAGTASEVRSNLRKFNGFPFDTKAAEYAKREAALAKYVSSFFFVSQVD